MSGRISKTFTITANPEMMQKLERFLSVLHWYTNWGHSAFIGFSEDGDGQDHVTVEGADIDDHRDFANWLSGRSAVEKRVESCDHAMQS